MRAAAEDLDLRQRQQRGVGAAEVLAQRHAARRAAACAAAIDTASVALAPSRDLFGVPSSAISARVERGLVVGVACRPARARSRR